MSAAPRVTCVGELIADLYATDDSVPRAAFRPRAGGAAANVAVGLAKLAVASGFSGKVGDDLFGRFLVSELRKARVDTRGIVFDPDHRTRLAFIAVDRSGERSFEFWESDPADTRLRRSEINRHQVERSSIVHVSSFLLLQEPSRSTAFFLARLCRRHGVPVSFDPNLRKSLWPSPAEARRVMLAMVALVDIVRLNGEEAYFLTRTRDLRSAAKRLRSLGPSLVVITKGREGAYLASGDAATFVPGFAVRAVDTTGCGDGFLAGLLCVLARSRTTIDALNEVELRSHGRFANAVGALTSLKYGVVPALPTLTAVRKFLQAQP